jgi:hypothetical protein
MAWRTMIARIVVNGVHVRFETLAGRGSVSLAVAQVSTIEDVSFGSRLQGLRLDGTPFYRQPLALYAAAEWSNMLGRKPHDLEREEALWKLLRRPGDDA